LASLISFCLINAIVGGQALVAASRDFDLSLTAGIVVVAIVSLALSFLGYRALHVFARIIWVPVLVAFVILAVCAGIDGGLSTRADLGPSTTANMLSFAAIILGWTISYSPVASDWNTCARDRPRRPQSCTDARR
jgi:purine-cytosine permease-like protein